MSKYLFIIPCYNEEKRINLDAFGSFLSSKEETYSFLFVNDGSKDNTAGLIESFCENRANAELLNLKKNVGKAEAIRSGVLSANSEKYNYIGYFDADLATPLNELVRLTTLSEEKSHALFLMGSRIKILGITVIKRKLSRHYIGRIFATIVSNLLQLPVYDTQCGAKLIKSELAKEIFMEPFSSKWLFDVELLFRIKKVHPDYATKVVEMPLNKWEDIAGSKIKMSYYLKAPIDLLRIYLRYR